MQLIELDSIDVDVMWYAAHALEAEARFERELALRLAHHGNEAWRDVRKRSQDKRQWAEHIRKLCSRAWQSRTAAEWAASHPRSA